MDIDGIIRFLMNSEFTIKELLVRFAEGKCSEEERREVVRYFQQRGAASEMPSVEDVLEAIGHRSTLDRASADRIYRKIMTSTDQPMKKERRLIPFGTSVLKYAAAVGVVVVTGVAVFLPQNRSSATMEQVARVTEGDSTADRVSEITLELADGRVEVIDPAANRMIRAADGSVLGHQEKDQLAYHGTASSSALAYNIIRVSYGERFRLLLSDGTTVHLNAGTTLKFPVRFLDVNQNREVFLEGEAYFEVARNDGQPFIVDTGDMDIRVLGTKFNVSTYPDDRATDVVLVEGRVQLDAKDNNLKESRILEPGFKASFDREKNRIVTREVTTSAYTSWTQGELVFRNITFEDMLKKLERKYNVTIENRNVQLAGERFNANFGDKPIEAVLNGLKAAYEIEFEINNNHVIIW